MGTKKATTKQAVKVKDLPAKNAKNAKDVKGGARLGGCAPDICMSNHNETLLRD